MWSANHLFIPMPNAANAVSFKIHMYGPQLKGNPGKGIKILKIVPTFPCAGFTRFYQLIKYSSAWNQSSSGCSSLQTMGSKGWLIADCTLVPYMLAVFMTSATWPKWKHSQMCLKTFKHHFLTNLAINHLKNCCQWLFFIPFLLTGSMMLLCFGSPLRSLCYLQHHAKWMIYEK